MEKRNKIIYWIATGLLSLLMVMSAGRYFFEYAAIGDIFVQLGYNSRIVIPLAIVKILGVVAIVSSKSKILKEWAYFGFLVDFILALEGHLAVSDGMHGGAIIALVLWTVSYIFSKKV